MKFKAYQVELESMAVKLEVENEQLLREEVMKMLLLFNCVILIFFFSSQYL